ncbi:MAG TPA: tetratricopeptide repeat protein, partial [Nannocystaceae bacterium]|nr:tetratricopeptide repeat protein [Nannocystaceae bacterium]
DVLRNADASVVLRGVETITGLRSIEPCGDLDALQRGVAPPPVESIEAITDVRAEVQAALVLDRAGRTQSAQARFEDAVARAEALGWRPLQVELEAARQRLSRPHGDATAEAKRLRGVLDTALAVGDLRSALEIANDLGWQWGYLEHDRDRGLEWIATARALAEQIDFDWLTEVRVLNNEAVIRAAALDFDGAAPLFERALALAEEHDHDGLRPVQLRANLAAFWAERGEYRRAADLLEATREGYQALIGDNHPRIGDVYANLGSAYLMLADPERAATSFDRAQAIFDPILPPDHPQRAHVLSGRATLERMRGNRARAIELAREALAMRRTLKQDREVAHASTNLATALLDGDRDGPEVLAEADALAVAAFEIMKDGPPGLRFTPLALRIDIALRRNDVADATALLESLTSAVAQTELTGEKRLSLHVLAVRTGLARHDDAAVKAAIDAGEAELLRSAELLPLPTELFALAEGRWELDYDRPRAIELAARSLAILEKRNDVSGRRDEVREWLRDKQ